MDAKRITTACHLIGHVRPEPARFAPPRCQRCGEDIDEKKGSEQ